MLEITTLYENMLLPDELIFFYSWLCFCRRLPIYSNKLLLDFCSNTCTVHTYWLQITKAMEMWSDVHQQGMPTVQHVQ